MSVPQSCELSCDVESATPKQMLDSRCDKHILEHIKQGMKLSKLVSLLNLATKWSTEAFSVDKYLVVSREILPNLTACKLLYSNICSKKVKCCNTYSECDIIFNYYYLVEQDSNLPQRFTCGYCSLMNRGEFVDCKRCKKFGPAHALCKVCGGCYGYIGEDYICGSKKCKLLRSDYDYPM